MVCEMEAESRHFGEVVVVRGEEAGRQVQGMVNFGPNVVSFLEILGVRGCYVVRTYVTPNNMPAVHQMNQALSKNTKGIVNIFMGDLNASL